VGPKREKPGNREMLNKGLGWKWKRKRGNKYRK
jgi:hypothetical protein